MEILKNIPMILASIGLVLATSSFISGLQLIKIKRSSIDGIIHRFNGYSSVVLLSGVAITSFINNGMQVKTFLGWLFVFGLISLKITIVRRRSRRAFKYVSWIGASMILVWLYVLVINIPL